MGRALREAEGPSLPSGGANALSLSKGFDWWTRCAVGKALGEKG